MRPSFLRFAACPALILALSISALSRGRALASSGLQIFTLPAAEPAPASPPTFAAVLLGGAGDVDDATRFLCSHSGGGSIVVLRSSGADAYNPYFHSLCPHNSVTTLLITSAEGARDPAALDAVRQAHAIFIAGGDQSHYVNFWPGPLLQEINRAIARGVPIGGISAGLAVLGQFVFSARNDTITSAEAFANPFDPKMTLDRDFLSIPQLRGVITDSHFSTRSRLGRTLAFMARIVHDGWAPRARAIGIDQSTAVLFDSSGIARVVGAASAFFLSLDHAPEVCEPAKPLTVRGITAYNLSAASGVAFDLNSWSPQGSAQPYSLSVENGRLTQTR
jgi:cyanophycinase